MFYKQSLNVSNLSAKVGQKTRNDPNLWENKHFHPDKVSVSMKKDEIVSAYFSVFLKSGVQVKFSKTAANNSENPKNTIFGSGQ